MTDDWTAPHMMPLQWVEGVPPPISREPSPYWVNHVEALDE